MNQNVSLKESAEKDEIWLKKFNFPTSSTTGNTLMRVGN